MLMYGLKEGLNYLPLEYRKQLQVFNFASISEEGICLSPILPYRVMQVDGSVEFDLELLNYILSDDTRFVLFFSVIYAIYQGYNCYVIVTRDDDFYDMLNDSFFKILEARYGFIANQINCPEDLYYMRECNFTIPGLHVFDADRDRYSRIMYNMTRGEDSYDKYTDK